MNSPLHLVLNTTPEQSARLAALQVAFAEVCNALAPVVQETRCWNRVALHHLSYHDLRQRFPQVGSQMVCNAIYSVSRTCRLILQHPNSPFNIGKHPDRPLPLLQFLPSAPVYFDRHTLSLKDGLLSMYTLDGRMRFQLALKGEDELRFHQEKLREIVLSRHFARYQLSFWLAVVDADADEEKPTASEGEMPEYIVVHAAESEEASVIRQAAATLP
ncbi:hypothetical protein [Accumulibacter sp.]|uniref:hypothetical protein n=1 Tax=Accumulibacter sp. TaxID=2053492 RepID=UPI0028C4640B|nr:hypothetical protein [Accumulibacter sp.]